MNYINLNPQLRYLSWKISHVFNFDLWRGCCRLGCWCWEM